MNRLTGTAVDGSGRTYLPPMGRKWLLPLYDPITRLLGVRAVHRRLLAQAGLRPGQQVLEIGCGTGNLLLEAAGTAGVTAIGLDPDRGALARAGRKARRRGVTVRLDHGFADDLPYPDGSIDVVLSAFMLHHLPAGEREQAMREVYRVLRAGGELHLVDIGGHVHPADGWVAHRARGNAILRDNFDESIPDLLRRAGFDGVAETGTDVRRRVGRFTFYRAVR